MLGKEAPSRARKEVKAGDVLVSTVRPNLNAIALVPTELDGEIASTGFCVLRANRKITEPGWIFYRCLTPEFVSGLVGQMRGANYPAVSDGIVKSSPLPLPTLREQRRIVELLEQADALRRQHTEGEALASRILPALFHKLFGNLGQDTKNWHCDALGSVIADTRNGIYKHADFYGRGTQILKMFNILAGRLNLERVDYVEVTADEFASYRLEPGDILINRVNTPELVGKCAVIQSELGDAVFESKNIRVRLNAALAHPEYVAHFLNTSFGHSTLCQGLKHAIGMATINNSDLRNCRIPLPPIELQTEWAKHVAAARTIATRTESSGKRIERLFQVLLHRAFTGELTARWREAHMKELLAEMELQSKALA